MSVLATNIYYYNLTGGPIWYSSVATTRTANTFILTSRVLPYNHCNRTATENIVHSVLTMFSNICFIIINESSMIITIAKLFRLYSIPAWRTILIYIPLNY